jgi:hypothetical protein
MLPRFHPCFLTSTILINTTTLMARGRRISSSWPLQMAWAGRSQLPGEEVDRRLGPAELVRHARRRRCRTGIAAEAYH